MKEMVDTTMEEQVCTRERPSKLAKLDADECSICIHNLTWLGSSDCNLFLTILRKIHTQLVQNKASDQSLCSLCRVLTLRLGCLIGCNAPEVAEIVSLCFQCLQYCFRTTILIDPSEAIVTFRTIVQLLDCFVGHNNELGRNALELFQIWLNDSALRKYLAKDRSTLEDMILVLIKITSSRKHPAMAMEIQHFLRRHICAGPDAAQISLFKIALQVLDENSVPYTSTYKDKDQLFLIQCLALMENRQPSVEHLETIVSLLDSPTETATRAMQVLHHCSQHLTNTQRDKCTHVIIERVMDPQSSESTLFPALGCLEALLIHRVTPLSMEESEELLDLCADWAMEEPTFHQQLQTRATSISITLITIGMQNASTKTKKHRITRILSQILLSCQSNDLTSRAVALACEWTGDVDLRNEILQVLPNLLNSLVHLIIMDRANSSDTLAILKSISTMVHAEPSSQTMVVERSLLPKLLDAVVAILQRSPVSDHHPIAMNFLLILSQNPCHRRILAKHPGVLSSMIHFLRSHGTTHPMPGSSPCLQLPNEGEMKRHVLLIAQAL